jgi:hypothetical protein
MSEYRTRRQRIRHLAPYALLLLLCVSCHHSSTLPLSVTKEYTFENIPEGRKALTVTNESSWAANTHIDRSASFQNRLQGNIHGVKSDLEEALRFNANPPPVSPSRAAAGQRQAFSVFSEGESKDFWVTNALEQFVKTSATLKKQGEHGNVWIADNVSLPISDSDANELSAKFDAIYPLATNLLGYEKGGGPDGDGGIDGESRIQILIYNCPDDALAGYFASKDEYTQAYLNSLPWLRNIKSNEAEIFYINAHFFDNAIDRNLIYSTLIHEFQHMINYNRKALNPDLRGSSATWYDEMLSMLAEDIIGPLVGIDVTSAGHPINVRIPLFLGLYWNAGVTEWRSSDDVILSYSAVYAFGAYLVRNYGGPALLKAMMDNAAVNQDSISRALGQMPGNSITSFEQALNNYAQALLYSSTKTPGGAPEGKPSFDRSVTSDIGGITYTAERFDIWNMKMPPEILEVIKEAFQNDPKYNSDYKGPVIIPSNFWKTQMPAYSVFLRELPTTISGTWSTTLTIMPSTAVINVNVVPY